jgi:A/G-specific adenine glycosylase
VLSRVFRIGGNPKRRKTIAKLWEHSSALVRAAHEAKTLGTDRCSQLNQALMELGALICTPNQPACPICPLRRTCGAQRVNRVSAFPGKTPRPSPEHRRVAAFVVRRGSLVLVRQRENGVVNGHLWEFPGGDLNGIQPAALARKTLGFRPRRMSHLLTIKHSITRFRITLDAWELEVAETHLPLLVNGQWVTAATLNQLPLPSAHRKIATTLFLSTGHQAIRKVLLP